MEARIGELLDSPVLDAAVEALEQKSGGLFLYARLLEQRLEAEVGAGWIEGEEHGANKDEDKVDFDAIDALPQGLDDFYAENFARAFGRGDVDGGGVAGVWERARPLLEAAIAAREPPPLDLLRHAVSDEAMAALESDAVSLLLPVRDGRLHVLHKSVVDWLTDAGQGPGAGGQSGRAARAGRFHVDASLGEALLARACAVGLQEVARVVDAAPPVGSLAAQQLREGAYDDAMAALREPHIAYALAHGVAHMLAAGGSAEAACDLRYIEAKAAVGRAFELPVELRRVHERASAGRGAPEPSAQAAAAVEAEATPGAAAVVAAAAPARAQGYARFATLMAARLAKRPWDALPMAANFPDHMAPAVDARAGLGAGAGRLAPSPARASTAGAMWPGKFAAIGSASHGRCASRAAISVAKRA